MTEQADRGFVYVMTNRSHRRMVKIGSTAKHPRVRAKELSSTGVPHPFRVHWHSGRISDYRRLEKRVHKALAKERVSKRREFFRVTPEIAVETIERLLSPAAKLELAARAEVTEANRRRIAEENRLEAESERRETVRGLLAAKSRYERHERLRMPSLREVPGWLETLGGTMPSMMAWMLALASVFVLPHRLPPDFPAPGWVGAITGILLFMLAGKLQGAEDDRIAVREATRWPAAVWEESTDSFVTVCWGCRTKVRVAVPKLFETNLAIPKCSGCGVELLDGEELRGKRHLWSRSGPVLARRWPNRNARE